MKLIELHLLQSFPFTCLNRDDVGAPKTAYFGGVQRARVSSQSWKRAIRERAFELAPEYFAGKRGHFHSEALRDKLIEQGVETDKAQNWAVDALTELGKKGKKEGQTAVALYLSPLEIEAIAKKLVESAAESKKGEIDKKVVAKAIKDAKRRDFADVAIFGRMVADDHTLMLEGAGMFAHALSTHEAANEIDFFSAVDDTKPTDDAGAGHIGVLEANSACYYRYIGLNVDLLFDVKDGHLRKVEREDKEAALKAFLRAVLEAVPKARKNSMFGYSLPEYALGLVRDGQPLSLVNAFETPVTAGKDGGYLEKSVAKLEAHREKLVKTYGLQKDGDVEVKLSEDNPLDAWIDALVAAALGE